MPAFIEQPQGPITGLCGLCMEPCYNGRRACSVCRATLSELRDEAQQPPAPAPAGGIVNV